MIESIANLPSANSGALLLVAAKSLQGYVLGSDKLREMVGATQLIEDFCSETFTRAFLKACSISESEYKIVTCAAGQTTVSFHRLDEARRVAALWPWAAHQHAPGLEVHVSVSTMPAEPGAYTKAIDSIQVELAQSRNALQILDLPAAPPPAMRAKRSGRAAQCYESFSGKSEEVDSTALMKRRRRHSIRNGQRTGTPENPVFAAFGFDPDEIGMEFEKLANAPILLKNFVGADGKPLPFHARQPALAVIHADGNGLGQAFIDLADALKNATPAVASECLSQFSSAFREVGLLASREAMAKLRETYLPPLPVLPIVLAGDDLTVVTRSELAIPFAEAWLRAFEEHSKEALRKLKSLKNAEAITSVIEAEKLTAGAGIAFFPQSHPFVDAYAACADLAGFAKAKAKTAPVAGGTPSSLAFQRIHVSGGADVMDEGALSDGEAPRRRLSGMPYYLCEPDESHPTLDQLRELRDAIREMPSGTVRHLLSEMRHAPDAAQSWWKRALNMLESKTAGKERRARIEGALSALHGTSSLWNRTLQAGKAPWSALPDALDWAAIEPALPSTLSSSAAHHEI